MAADPAGVLVAVEDVGGGCLRGSSGPGFHVLMLWPVAWVFHRSCARRELQDQLIWSGLCIGLGLVGCHRCHVILSSGVT